MIEKFINKIHCGNALEILRQLPDKSISSIITSPPYWQLRCYSDIPDYIWDGDKNCESWKGQLGLEPSFELYLKHLWQIMDECWRILVDTGTCWINLGDTYGTTSGNITQGNLGTNKIKYTGSIPGYNKSASFHKCQLLIPHRFAIGCVGKGWIVRNDIKWLKPNGMPESVTDRFSKKSEYVFFMVKKSKYYFDLDGIRDKIKTQSIDRSYRGVSENNKWLNSDYSQTLDTPRKRRTKIPKDQAECFGSPRAMYHREKKYDTFA